MSKMETASGAQHLSDLPYKKLCNKDGKKAKKIFSKESNM